MVAVVEFDGPCDALVGVAEESDGRLTGVDPVEPAERRSGTERGDDRLRNVERREETGAVLGGEEGAVTAGGRRRFDAGRATARRTRR